MQSDLKFIQGFIKTLQNKHRIRIIKICYKNPKSISELARILKSSKKVTWFNVKQLESFGFVSIKKSTHKRHNPVEVTSNIKYEYIENKINKIKLMLV